MVERRRTLTSEEIFYEFLTQNQKKASIIKLFCIWYLFNFQQFVVIVLIALKQFVYMQIKAIKRNRENF